MTSPAGPEMASTSSATPIAPVPVQSTQQATTSTTAASPAGMPESQSSMNDTSGQMALHGAQVEGGDPLTGSAGAGQASGEARRDEGAITPPVPKCHLRTLIISGQSHVFSFEPELTVGRVKELIWSSWPSEWTDPSAPPSPAFLRVLYSGRILQDDTTLAANSIPSALQATNPAVVHISVRSFSLHGDEDPKKNGLVPSLSRRSSRRRSTAQQDEVGGCKCVIM